MKPPNWRTSAQRSRVLQLARELARSGQHPDHMSIIMELEPMDGFAETRDRLRDIRAQLDHLCRMARSGRPRIDIPGR
jgi:hypothetical protein